MSQQRIRKGKVFSKYFLESRPFIVRHVTIICFACNIADPSTLAGDIFSHTAFRLLVFLILSTSSMLKTPPKNALSVPLVCLFLTTLSRSCKYSSLVGSGLVCNSRLHSAIRWEGMDAVSFAFFRRASLDRMFSTRCFIFAFES